MKEMNVVQVYRDCILTVCLAKKDGSCTYFHDVVDFCIHVWDPHDRCLSLTYHNGDYYEYALSSLDHVSITPIYDSELIKSEEQELSF